MSIRLPVLVAFLFFCIFNHVAGKSRLIEPRQRSSLWRDPRSFWNINVRTNNLNCGGAWKLRQYRGRCGVCGDAWDLLEPRPNEAGGIYANGIIAKTYSSDTRFIYAVVEVTSSISGYLVFNICPNNNVNKRVSEKCLNSHPMKIFNTNEQAFGNKYYLKEAEGDENGFIHLLLEKPKGMMCSQCVLRMKLQRVYGYGQREETRNCADIAILPDTNPETTTGPVTAAPTTAAPTTAAPITAAPTTAAPTTAAPTTAAPTTAAPTTAAPTTAAPTTAAPTTAAPTTAAPTTAAPTTAAPTTAAPTTAAPTTAAPTTAAPTSAAPTTPNINDALKPFENVTSTIFVPDPDALPR